MMKNKNHNVKSTMKHIVLAVFLGIWGACGGAGDEEDASDQDQKDAEAMAVQEIDPEEYEEQANPPGGE